MRVRQVRTEQDLNEVRVLFREYEVFLNINLDFQIFEEEIAGLPGEYVPPDGEILIAYNEERSIGCVAVRRLNENICEMKRLFVRQEAKGIGMGRQLAQNIIHTARDFGYSRMRLDTLERLKEAMCLYESLGFRRIAPYYDNPLQGVIYRELDLLTLGNL